MCNLFDTVLMLFLIFIY